MTSSTALMARARAGELTDGDLEPIVGALASPDEDTDIIECLLVIGRAVTYGKLDQERYLEPVEAYLKSSYDPWYVRTALWILVGYWGRAEPYLGRILQVIRGLDWEIYRNVPSEFRGIDDARTTAIYFAGEYLKDHDDDDMMKLLLRIANDSDEPEYIREAAQVVVNRT